VTNPRLLADAAWRQASRHVAAALSLAEKDDNEAADRRWAAASRSVARAQRCEERAARSGLR